MIKQTLFIVLTLICCNAVFSQTDEKGIVLGVERSTANAFTKHDIPFLTAVFTEDASITSATGELVSKQQMLQSVPNINSVTVSDLKVRVEGYIAIVTGVATETGKDSHGGAYSTRSRFTDVFEKNKGNWQIIASQATAMQ